MFTCTNCGFGVHGPVVKCPDCGIIYTEDTVSQKKISTYYEVAEDPLYFAEQKAREITFKGYLKKLEQIYPAKGKLLDVGTNTGLFVRLVADSGWAATGLEPNKWGAAYAKEHYKINLISKPFEKGIFRANAFDVITMWDVIEHFTDPISEIDKVFHYLKPGGVFAFSTVDPESFLARIWKNHWSWYMEMHRVFFSQKAAFGYLSKAGFKKIIFRPHFRNLSVGYLSSRLVALNPAAADIAQAAAKMLGISDLIVPYYANDLYDCYAWK